MFTMTTPAFQIMQAFYTSAALVYGTACCVLRVTCCISFHVAKFLAWKDTQCRRPLIRRFLTYCVLPAACYLLRIFSRSKISCVKRYAVPHAVEPQVSYLLRVTCCISFHVVKFLAWKDTQCRRPLIRRFLTYCVLPAACYLLRIFSRSKISYL